MSDQLAEKFEKRIQEFERKRELLEREIIKIRDEVQKITDSMFDNIIKEVNPYTDETDLVIESCIKEFKKLLDRKKELNNIKEKLTPMLDMLKLTANA